MKYPTVFSALLMALALSACDKPAVVNPAAVVTAPVPEPAGPTGATGSTGSPTTASPGVSADPSLPSATPGTSAVSPASLQGKADPQRAMTKQEEAIAMPMVRQAGDHSTPALKPPK